MSSGPRDLLFVNKDSRSTFLSRSQDGEHAFILSHAQRHRRRGSSRQTWSRHTSQFALKQQENTTTSESSGPVPISRAISPSNNGSDPFHSTIVALDAGNHAMLRFTFGQGAKLTFMAEAFAPSALVQLHTQMRHELAINQRLKRCVEDEALMYSTLAYGSCCQGWMGGIVERKRSPQYLMQKALKAVQRRLEDTRETQIDNWLVLSIYGLAITEFWTDRPGLWKRCPDMFAALMGTPKREISASRVHLNALIRLVDNAGGWNQFDPYVLESTILLDKFLALTEFKTPLLPLTWDPITITPGHVESTVANGLGQDLLVKTVSLDLYILLQDIVSYMKYAVNYWSGTERQANIESNLFLKLQALIYRLLNLQGLVKLDNCICLTTLVFQLSITQYHGSQVAARTLIPRLRQAIVEARFWEDEVGEDLRFWCLYTGAMAAEASPDKDWFISMIQWFCLPSVNEYQAREILGRYLFLPDRQGEQLSRLVNILNP
ncbi:hypothetical protein FBEOM_406 [Fusarium beomiforme]|uniref:Uncharacterized protein n=1 Tax=Fusarium beomiforme TaxID=44412 RepID=A0A9P5E211_9HYPO|nr:hypothetical protein FBEOM_406 [Fusarium beomiforme]